jgi:hypothetical protein
VCGDAGDGAGLLAAIPQAFFKEEAKRLRFDGARELRAEDAIAVGVLFIFEADPARAEQVRVLVREVFAGGPVKLLGFRPVPTHEDVLPALPTPPSGVTYAHSVDEALSAVARRPGLAILMPVPDFVDVLRAAEADRLLPEKATSFQPKPSVGVLIRSLRDE